MYSSSGLFPYQEPGILSMRTRGVVPSSPPKQKLNSDALFAKELCDILSSLEAANPGIGRALACILTGDTIKSKSKKVSDCPRTGIHKEKSLRRKDKKSGTIRKVPAAA
jgi:hypothetical protein